MRLIVKQTFRYAVVLSLRAGSGKRIGQTISLCDLKGCLKGGGGGGRSSTAQFGKTAILKGSYR